MYQSIFDKIAAYKELERDEVLQLLQTEDQLIIERLYDHANQYRKKYVGNEVHMRGLIEFSNYCRRNCTYCGIRRDNSNIPRYRMEASEIISTASQARQLGYWTVVLQSGEDAYYTVDMLEEIIRSIKRDNDIAITLSIGERPRQEYERLFAAGADRFLMRFETSNPDLYSKLHPDSKYQKRFQALEELYQIGYQVGSGIMAGLPEQTLGDIADDIIKFRELDLDMIGFGPYICHEETPLAGSENGTVEMTFKVIALTRIVTRRTHIPATTALSSLRPDDGREIALEVGANVVMPNVTPVKYRSWYALYPAKVCIGEDASQCRSCMGGRISGLGRPISIGPGHAVRKTS